MENKIKCLKEVEDGYKCVGAIIDIIVDDVIPQMEYNQRCEIFSLRLKSVRQFTYMNGYQ